MIGKVLRFVLMDKQARSRWQQVEDARAQADGLPPPAQAANDAAASGAFRDHPDDDANMIRDAIAMAAHEAEGESRSDGKDKAEASVATATTPASIAKDGGKAPDTGRAALLSSALAVHRRQQVLLSRLDPQRREKLRRMAESMLGLDPDASK